MAQTNWMVKQILSPIVGMERWFNTGNANEILWGFQDALGAMPLINTMRFDDAAQTYAELMTEAQELDGKGDPNSMPQAFGLVTSAVISPATGPSSTASSQSASAVSNVVSG